MVDVIAILQVHLSGGASTDRSYLTGFDRDPHHVVAIGDLDDIHIGQTHLQLTHTRRLNRHKGSRVQRVDSTELCEPLSRVRSTPVQID